MICFQISIFEPLETTMNWGSLFNRSLWFAFKLVSLNHWKQRLSQMKHLHLVVICFQISIFEPLETTPSAIMPSSTSLWFAFKLVSLNHWKQLQDLRRIKEYVVICFQISIFEPLETTTKHICYKERSLWFAFKLVSLNHWKQPQRWYEERYLSCDLLSN